ncbi:MAG: cobyric acid synthase [Planctomycetota bacterium]|nr:cobyric acid synthase [Planctomycetota bacterium]
MKNAKTGALAPCLAVFGAASDVGKSLVATALCRIFSDLGYRVAPFKAQNMSNNSFVTAELGEMGRAQVVQAEAARIVPHVDMNPVLLKPSTDTRAQVVVHGKVVADKEARDYFSNTSKLKDLALESLQRLRRDNDLVIIEGAGSCAELNLRKQDYVNFEMALATNAPVLIVADIDKGGVFAQTLGTLSLLDEKEQDLVAGFIINKFRGDPALFYNGIDIIESRSKKQVLGLVPFFRHIEIDSEDGLSHHSLIDPKTAIPEKAISVAILLLPHISNFTDFSPFERDDQLTVHYLSKQRSLKDYDLLILPGSKNVRADLRWLDGQGWREELLSFTGQIVGVCGGYQILGQTINDPAGLESQAGESLGLGLIDMDTELAAGKVLKQVKGRWSALESEIEGYEIHLGHSVHREAAYQALLAIESDGETRSEGYASADRRIIGTYVHGLFDRPEARQRFLHQLSNQYDIEQAKAQEQSAAEYKNSQYDLLAAHFREHLDLSTLTCALGLPELTQ